VNQLDKTAYKHKRTPATPSIPGSKESWTLERSFLCNWRDITPAEQVRAGRDTTGRERRFFYFPRMVSFAYNDKIYFDSMAYKVIAVPSRAHAVPVDFVDTKAEQSQ